MFSFQSGCPIGWYAIANSCYMVSNGAMNTATAIVRCRDEGGFLAVVTSAAERDAIRSVLLSVNDLYVNIDGSDAELEGTWKTQTGETMQNLPWQVGPGATWSEPDGGTSENCLTMDTNQFADIRCDYVTSGALCELQLV